MRLSTLRRPGLASEAEVLDRVNRVLGPVEILDDASVRPQVCRILKVETRSGEQSFVKWYSTASDYQRECDALTLYTPALGTDAPRLIADDEALQMVLISRVPGRAHSPAIPTWESPLLSPNSSRRTGPTPP